MTDMYNEYAETLSQILGTPNAQILEVSEPNETHQQFTDRMIQASDRLLGNNLDPVQILYRKSEDTSLLIAGYETLMRAARYLYEQSHTPETEMEFELRSPRNPFASLHRH